MVVYAGSISDPNVRALMRSMQDAIGSLVRRTYETGPLYADSLMLCRWPTGRSMPAHVDNQATHHYSTPWRSHSAIVYLNDDLEGGELFWTRFHVELTPARGLLVAFPAGEAFEHGVRRIRSGTRYTMACWFTEDANAPTRAEPCPRTADGAPRTAGSPTR